MKHIREKESKKQVTLSRFFATSKPMKRDAKEDVSEEAQNSKRPRCSGKEIVQRGVSKLQAFAVDEEPEDGPAYKEKGDTDSESRRSEEKAPRRVFVANFSLTTDRVLSTGLRQTEKGCITKLLASEKRTDDDSVNYTPLEKQYMAIKERNPDTLLFVECGYKYRFFGEDAEVAAKELNIFAHPVNNFMSASIPVHRLAVHLQRLVSKGYKVGVVRQTETAALKAAGSNKNAPFSRNLDEIYTRATLFSAETDLKHGDEWATQTRTSASFGGFIICLYEGGPYLKSSPSIHKSPLERTRERKAEKSTADERLVDIGVIAVQPSTKTTWYDFVSDTDTRLRVETIFEMTNPSEIVIASSISERTRNLLSNMKIRTGGILRIEEINEEVLKSFTCSSEKRSSLREEILGNGKTQMEDNVQSTSDTKFASESVLELPEVVQKALQLASIYLRQFKLESVLQGFDGSQRFSSDKVCMKLNGTTLRNLEIFKNLANGGENGTLFRFMNHTNTAFGSRLLHRWMSRPMVEARLINQRLQKVTEIKACLNSSIWKALDKEMQQLPDLERGLALIQYLKASPPEFLKFMKAFEKISQELLSHALEGMIEKPDWKTLLTEAPKTVLRLVRSSMDELNISEVAKGDKSKLFKEKEKFPALFSCLQRIEDTLEELQHCKVDVRKTLKSYSLDYVSVSGNEFLIEVKNSLLHVVPDDWIKIMSTKQVSRFRPPAVDQAFKQLCQLRETVKIESDKAWLDFLRSFSVKCEDLRHAVQCLAELDCLMSLAKVATRAGFVRPEVDNATCQLKITNGFHPVIRSLLGEQQQFVPNDTDLKENGTTAMVITGPNMGGKSSYIRQVALTCLLAQMGSYVPAESVVLSPLDAIFTRMGAADDITKGRSTFMLELEEASEALRCCTKNSLVVLDELGRGTATHDGAAIAYATLEYLMSEIGCFTLFVTHYPLLGDFALRTQGAISNFHMAFVYGEEEGDLFDNCATDRRKSAKATHLQKITFLYKLEKGKAAKSYGLNVARLANMPGEILVKAAEKAQELEKATARKRQFKSCMDYTDGLTMTRAMVRQTLDG